MPASTSSQTPPYQIVIPQAPTTAEKRAAEELERCLHEITGAHFPIVDDAAPARDHEFVLGRNARLRELDVRVPFDRLKEDGFILKTVGDRLVIVGGSEKGVLYGVYTFLEDYLGRRKYSSKAAKIPKRESLVLPEIDDMQVPVVKSRDLYYLDAWDPAFTDWHKLDSNMHNEWGLWVHTFGALVPPDKYFKDHPEYFAEIGGHRVAGGQLCLTNPGAFRVLVENLRKRMDEKPEAKVWSVSQNDIAGYCTCPDCRAIDEREGAPMGSLLTFVNKVAAEFPDKIISTLAYQYSRSAPKTVRPADGVIIVLCSIECNRSRPIATDPLSESFRKDVEDWAKICENILIWDYVIQFKNLVSPFPNLRVLQPNMQYFVKNNCVHMFKQGNRDSGGEFAELRAYLLAKLLWDPNADVDALMDDFLGGYYGAAGPLIREYVDLMHDALEESGESLEIFGNPASPIDGYLSPSLMKRYNALFDEAEKAVAGEPDVLERVRAARLPIQYAALEQAKRAGTGDRGVFAPRGKGQWTVRPEIVAQLGAFVERCNKAKISRLSEWHTTPDEYREKYLQFLERKPVSHLALGKRATFVTPYSPKYPACGDTGLTNGIRGGDSFELNWVGFEGSDVEIVVDLERLVPIRSVRMDFIQASDFWIFLPKRVSYFVSGDGESFRRVAEIGHDAPETRDADGVRTFAAELDGAQARYVRVHAVNRKTCPEWHVGAGGSCWLFTDEIIVE
jgi:hypothetical protein